MNYRFRPSDKPHVPSSDSLHRKTFRLKGYGRLRRSSADAESIRFFSLFEEAALPPAAPHKRKSVRFLGKRSIRKWQTVWRNRILPFFRLLRRRTEAFAQQAAQTIQQTAMRFRRTKKEKSIHAIPVFAGFLCAALLVSSVSAGCVLWGLFAHYRRSYRSITIPNFVGTNPFEATETETADWNFIIQYESNPDVEPGLVIAQSPQAGAVRRLYDRQTEYPIVITVSRAEDCYKLENLVGMSERNALLALRNHGVNATVSRLYSDSVPQGTVIQTIPSAHTQVAVGDSVTLQISMGTKADMIAIPSLIGMTENAAATLLKISGLTVGTISYQTSSYAAGTVIAQSADANRSVPVGTEVSYTVSAGNRYFVTAVPDIYGMTEKDAETVLRQYGLVIGKKIAVSNAAPNGTVLIQEPPAGTPITASTFSVTVYISS